MSREPAENPVPAGDGTKLRLALVISSLAPGGAERVMSLIASYWAESGHEITLITLDSAASDFYDVHPGVRRVALDLLTRRGKDGWARTNRRRIAALRRELRRTQFDVVISFMEAVNLLTLIAAIGSKTPVIVSERTDPGQFRIPHVQHRLRPILYRRAHGLVVQTEGVRRWADRIVDPSIVRVIPNPVRRPQSGSERTPPQLPEGPFVLGVGRLTVEKGFDLLVEAFARCVAHQPEWSLVIVGEGDEQNRLEQLAMRLGVSEQVRLVGRVRHPASVFEAASLFVLPSRFEGFPNALLEAMACGLTVISADCDSGPREIVRDGVDGVLVRSGEVDALVDAMERLMSTPALRARLASRATEVLERFSLERVMREWESLVWNVSTHGKKRAGIRGTVARRAHRAGETV